MSWERKSVMSQRLDFVRYYEHCQNMTEACEWAGISRPTGYKWWGRYQEDGLEGLQDQSRRPKTSPNKTSDTIEQRVLDVRESKKGDWGGRKIRQHLLENGMSEAEVPAASTITAILHRHDKIDDEESQKRENYNRFEADEPNDR